MMKPTKRGPRSAAELTVIQPLAPPPGGQLLPPSPLSPAERALWDRVIATAPRGLLHPSDALIVAGLVRHTCCADTLAQKLATLEPGGEDFERVAAAMARQTAQALSCARAARLTAHSRVPAPTAGTRAGSGTAAGPATLDELRQRYAEGR